MSENGKTWQLKCDKCGAVRLLLDPINEDDKVCPSCKTIITENNICGIVQEFLLE
jgi:hypothetical protein